MAKPLDNLTKLTTALIDDIKIMFNLPNLRGVRLFLSFRLYKGKPNNYRKSCLKSWNQDTYLTTSWNKFRTQNFLILDKDKCSKKALIRFMKKGQSRMITFGDKLMLKSFLLGLQHTADPLIFYYFVKIVRISKSSSLSSFTFSLTP